MPSHPHPKNPHLTDPFLLPFQSSSFDAPNYFNTALPTLTVTFSPTSKQSSKQPSKPLSSVSDHADQTQTLVSQLTAHTTLLSTLLTAQTDDILRTGSRLAYEVELLRGETLALSDTLNSTLATDVARFVPPPVLANTLSPQSENADISTTREPDKEDQSTLHNPPYKLPVMKNPTTQNNAANNTSLSALQTLTQVRTRLSQVLQAFDSALSWPLPPDSTTSSSHAPLKTTNAPSTPISTDNSTAQDTTQDFRTEISELFISDDGIAGVEAAAQRVAELRKLCEVWKGTAEEKVRGRFVDGLELMVEERRRAITEKARERDGGKQGTFVGEEKRVVGESERASPVKSDGVGAAGREGRTGSEAGYGFIDNLQRLRGNIYLE